MLLLVEADTCFELAYPFFHSLDIGRRVRILAVHASCVGSGAVRAHRTCIITLVWVSIMCCASYLPRDRFELTDLLSSTLASLASYQDSWSFAGASFVPTSMLIVFFHFEMKLQWCLEQEREVYTSHRKDDAPVSGHPDEDLFLSHWREESGGTALQGFHADCSRGVSTMDTAEEFLKIFMAGHHVGLVPSYLRSQCLSRYAPVVQWRGTHDITRFL